MGVLYLWVELSTEAIRLGREHAKKSLFADLADYRQYIAPETNPLPAKCAQLVIDVQTIQHLNGDAHDAIYREVYRILQPSSRFFSVHWSGTNEAVDAIFPAHPELKEHYNHNLKAMLMAVGFEVPYLEFVIKTYPGVELGQWTIIEAVKP